MSIVSVENQVAVVSGSSRGIGRACALLLAEHGANVVVNYNRNEDAAQEVVRRVHDLGRDAIAVQGDVSQTESAEALMRAATDRWGKIDILVSNAGAGTRLPITDTDDEEWERAVRLNIKSYFNLAPRCLPVDDRAGLGEGRWGQLDHWQDWQGFSSAVGHLRRREGGDRGVHQGPSPRRCAARYQRQLREARLD